MSTSKTPAVAPYTSVFAMTTEVEVYNVCDVLLHIYPGYWEMPWGTQPSYDVSRAAVAAWAAEHGADMYAEDREDFSVVTAAFAAERKGLRRVVVEDLS